MVDFDRKKQCRFWKCDKPRNPKRKDGYCSAKCNRAHRWDEIKFQLKHRRADPDHGWF